MNQQLPPSFWALEGAQPDQDELIIDSFAGGGGASTGIEIALGRSPDFAINHDPEALALHAANHPETVHLNSNIYQVDPVDVVGRRRVGLLWASPDCKDFSKAKGGTPVRRHIRGLAWTVVLWIERVRPRVIILENVEEFQQWGPVIDGPKGPIPDPDRRGQTFEEWTAAIRKNGYKVEWRELRACDYGAPTTRKRLFLIARCDGKPIVWPVPTHGAPTDADVIAGKKLPWRTAAADVIDWTIPCPSIFDTTEEILAKFGIRAIRPLAENTMARIAKGVKRYVIDAAKPFIVNLTHGVRTASADEPMATVTAAHRGEKGIVMPHITKFQSGAVGSDIEAPLPTITANSFIKRPGGAAPIGVVMPHLMTMRNAAKPHNEVDKPTHTVTAGGAGLALVAPTLVNVANSKTTGRGPNTWSTEEPVRTVTGAGGAAVVASVLSSAQHGGSHRPVDEPHRTIAASDKDQNQVIAATMVQTGERPGQEPRALDIEKPLGTVVAGAAKHAVVAAHIQRQFGASVGHAADEPSGTVTAGGAGKSALVSAYLAKHYGDTGQRPGSGADEPVSTVTASDHNALVSAGLINLKSSDRRMSPIEQPTPVITSQGTHLGEVRAFLMKYYGVDQDPRIEDPLSTVTTKDRFGIVMVEGQPYEIVDIGMRMLTPRELFKAQGFPADYEIETGVFADGARRALTKTAQVRMCGNSVCPPLAAALVAANCNEMAVAQKVAAE